VKETSQINDHERQEECHCDEACDLIDVAEQGNLSEKVCHQDRHGGFIVQSRTLCKRLQNRQEVVSTN